MGVVFGFRAVTVFGFGVVTVFGFRAVTVFDFRAATVRERATEVDSWRWRRQFGCGFGGERRWGHWFGGCCERPAP